MTFSKDRVPHCSCIFRCIREHIIEYDSNPFENILNWI